MLSELKEGLQKAISKLMGKSYVDEKTLKEFIRDIQRTLIKADVNVRLVLELSKRLEASIKNEKPPPGISLKEHVIYMLYREISRILGAEKKEKKQLITGKEETRILLVGLQGSGKTTAAAKLAYYYKNALGTFPILITTDTYRPGAYEQLKQLGEKIGVPVYGGKQGEDPVIVLKRALEEIKSTYNASTRGKKRVVIVDTAGRHKEERALLEEMSMLSKILNPDLVLLVIDGTIGQQAGKQAEAFHEKTPIGGIIVTKLDSTAKGGGALTAAAATGAQIYFVSASEKIGDIEEFDPIRFAGRLLGRGDLYELIRTVEKARDELSKEGKEVKQPAKMTLEEFVDQLEGLRKLGPFSKFLELMPIPIPEIPEDQIEKLEANIKRWKAIINSMTVIERKNPSLLNSSRVRRIARGAGVEEREVKELIRAYNQARRLARTMQKSRLRRMLAGLGMKRAHT